MTDDARDPLERSGQELTFSLVGDMPGGRPHPKVPILSPAFARLIFFSLA
jgi:hypothetical protein